MLSLRFVRTATATVDRLKLPIRRVADVEQEIGKPDIKTGTMTQVVTRRTNRLLANAMAAMMCVAVLSPAANAGHLYRYKNADGFWVISSSIPSDRVTQGYRIIDEAGRVVEEIAPQRSPEEARIYLAELEEQRKRDDAIRRINLLYGSEADIDHALKKALRSIDTSIANTQANIIHLRGQRQSLEDRAARIERAGNKITPKLVQNIETLDDQIQTLEREIASRQDEKETERQRHASDRDLFREVHEISASL